MNNWAWILFLSCAFLACDTDDSSMNAMSDGTVTDTGQQQSADAHSSDVGSVEMTDARVADAGLESRADTSTLPDGTVTAMDSAIEDIDTAVMPMQDSSLVDLGADVIVDASMPQTSRRSNGQCGDDDDCPNGVNGQNCSRALPGGTCLGCGTDADCPSDAACNFGTCVVTCGTDEDCAPGLSCLSRSRCGATACVDSLCPDTRFDCSDSDRCTRRPCNSAEECAAGTECVNGLCIESDWL